MFLHCRNHFVQAKISTKLVLRWKVSGFSQCRYPILNRYLFPPDYITNRSRGEPVFVFIRNNPKSLPENLPKDNFVEFPLDSVRTILYIAFQLNQSLSVDKVIGMQWPLRGVTLSGFLFGKPFGLAYAPLDFSANRERRSLFRRSSSWPHGVLLSMEINHDA